MYVYLKLYCIIVKILDASPYIELYAAHIAESQWVVAVN